MPHTAPGSRRPLADEETPLLGGGGGGHAPNPDGDNGRLHPAAGNGTANSSNGHGHGPSVDHQPNVCTTKAHLAHPYRSRHFVQAIVQFGLFVLALYMIVTPLSKLMEDFICRDMFPELIGVVVPGDAVDPRCKSAEVQGKLAKVTGTQLAIDNIPSLLLAMPYGVAADRYGRVPIFFLSYLGQTLGVVWYFLVLRLPNVFPIEAIYVSSAFYIIGGGAFVFNAITYTYLADIFPAHERTTAFSLAAAITLAVGMVASPLSGYLMEKDDWLAMNISLALLILGNIVVLFLPETLAEKTAIDVDEDVEPPKKLQILMKHVKNYIASLKGVWTFIVANKKLMLLFISISFCVLGKFMSAFLGQYITARYHWKWSKAAYLLTINGAMNLVVLLVVLPVAGRILMGYFGMSSIAKDILLTEFSGLAMIFGLLMIAVAFSPVIMAGALAIFSFSIGFPYLLRSVLHSIVEPHHIATLNMAISVMESVSLLVAMPAIAWSLQFGLGLGGAWIGLPFFVGAAFGFVATAFVLAYRMLQPSQKGQPVDAAVSPADDDEEQQ